MTFKTLWTSLKTAWQSRPLALILPVVALAVYWWTHGHTWAAASFPSMGEWVAGTTLLFTKFGRVMEVFVGPPAPETLPAPVTAPLLRKTSEVPKVTGLLLLVGLGFSFLWQACAHVSAIVKDVDGCVTADGPQAIRDIEASAGPFVETLLSCDPTFSAATLPECAAEGLAGVAASLGPDGQRFELCVVNAIENDPAAAALAKSRAHAARVKLVAAGNGR